MWTLLALSQESMKNKRVNKGSGRYNPARKVDQQNRVNDKIKKWQNGVTLAQAKISSHCGVDYLESELTGLHMKFHQRDQHSQRNFLFEQIHEYQKVRDENDGTTQTRWTAPLRDHDHSLCSGCWREAQGHIDKGRYRRAMTAVKSGANRQLPRSTKRRQSSGKTMSASAWLRTFGKDVGDFMPNENMIQLPAARVQELYGIYIEEMTAFEEDCLSRQAFGRMMKKEQIKYACKQMKKFSKCNECARLDVELQLAINTPECAIAKAAKEVHRVHVTAQKGKYYKHKQKGKSSRTCTIWLSIIIDGMDQAKTATPRLHRNPKNLDGHDVLNVHLTGVIIHGHLHQLYTWVDNFPKDSNVTATVLLEALKDLKKLKGPDYVHPRNLYLQLDNCSGENKNRFFLTFLALLVQLGVFDRIKLNFLQVGHTHEDIDQLFSRLSTLWVSCDIFSVDQLMEIAKTVNYQRETMKEIAARSTKPPEDVNEQDDLDEKHAEDDNEDGDEKETDEGAVNSKEVLTYKLAHRHLDQMADVNTWSEHLWTTKQWKGTSKFRCFDFRREETANPDGGEPIVRCRFKVRKCMCSEGDSRCDESLNNFWQPRTVGNPDGVILFGDDEIMPEVKNISTVLRKTLPIDRATIASYFSKLPAHYIRRQPKSGAQEEKNNSKSADLSEHTDRVHANPAVARGMNWFSDFFDEQEGYTESMCDKCRAYKTKEAEFKSTETSLVTERILRRSMREQRVKDAEAKAARHRAGKNPLPPSNDVNVEASKEDDQKLNKQLKKIRKRMRRLQKKVKRHVRKTKGDALHRYYEAGAIFGYTEEDVVSESEIESSDGDDNGIEAMEIDEPEPEQEDFIKEDEYESEFRVERVAEVRKVHRTGCVVGHLVVYKSEDPLMPFYVGKVLGRSVENPEEKFELQYYGNDRDTFDKAYLPGWRKKNGGIYYKEEARVRTVRTGELDTPYVDNAWIDALITWSCDWKLGGDSHLPAIARKRVEQTPNMAYKAPRRKKK